MVLQDNPLRDRKTKTSAPMLTAAGLIHAIEALENLRLVLLRNADA